MKYLVFLATGIVEIEADMVREFSYELPIEGQQPTVGFFKGCNPTADNIVGKFVLKNISGYSKASEVKSFTSRQLP